MQIPIQIVLDPYISILQQDAFQIQPFDFDFLLSFVGHPKLNIGLVSRLVLCMGEFAIRDILFSKSAILVMYKLIQRFQKMPVFKETILEFISNCINKY